MKEKFAKILHKPIAIITLVLIIIIVLIKTSLSVEGAFYYDGLRGDFYDGTSFNTFKGTYYDTSINYATDTADELLGTPRTGARDYFSARWTGYVKADYTETYTFSLNYDDGVALWVNGTSVISQWSDHSPTHSTGNIALTAGTWYPIKLEWYNGAIDATIQLRYSSASESKKVIPSTHLRSDKATSTRFTTPVFVTGGASVSGSLSKGSGTFVIDHPLDPENKLLYHSFVESPDVKNIYDGVATLDGNGEVIVELPEYFEVLNGQHRFLLTPMGESAPYLHVTQAGVQNNTFTIAGGPPHARVSWQVTGIRHDPYILANPIIPEVEKGPEALVDKGEYLFEGYKN